MKHEVHGRTRYCHGCDFYTYKSSTLSMHMAMKHPISKPHLCNICSESFSVKTQLNHHIVSHHKQASIPCPMVGCGLLFKNSATQQVHYVRQHMKHDSLFQIDRYKQFVCLQCNKQCKKAAIFYHVAQCSWSSPFTRRMTPDIQHLVDLSDDDDDDDDDDEEVALMLCELSAIQP